MNRVLRTRLLVVMTVAALTLMCGIAVSVAAPKDKATTKTRRPRLPNYYAKVVKEDQRSEINTIQEEFAPKIEKLQEQLDAIVAERNTAIEKVLTADQRKQIEALREEAAAKRKAGGNSTAGASEKTPKKTATKKAA